jgi:hypothetical protein
MAVSHYSHKIVGLGQTVVHSLRLFTSIISKYYPTLIRCQEDCQNSGYHDSVDEGFGILECYTVSGKKFNSPIFRLHD